MKKKWFSIIMVIALIAGMTAGCGKKTEEGKSGVTAGDNPTQDQSGQSENTPMGRYVEQTIVLPEKMIELNDEVTEMCIRDRFRPARKA